MRSRRGKSLIGHSCFQLCRSPKRGRVLFTAANYCLSSAPGQACAWRVRPHFGKGCRRIGGRERGKNVNPPPPWKSPNSQVRHPSSCQMKWCRLQVLLPNLLRIFGKSGLRYGLGEGDPPQSWLWAEGWIKKLLCRVEKVERKCSEVAETPPCPFFLLKVG